MAKLRRRLVTTVSGIVLASSSILCFASGAFNPSAPGPVDAKFTLGKSIVTGRQGDVNCSECHGASNKFKRNALRKLGMPISAVITNCDVHKPCYAAGQEKSLSDEELAGIDSYFKRRYRLK